MHEIIPRWKEETVEEMIYDEDGLELMVTKTKYIPCSNFPSPDEVRNRWTFGLPLSRDNGEVMSDEDLKHYIDEAIDEVEHRLGIYIKPTVIMTNPWERGFDEGVHYEVEEHPYDYNATDYRNYGFLQLRERPVQALDKLQLVLPNGQIIVDFTSDDTKRRWVKLDKTNAQLNIVPYGGDPALFQMMGGSASTYPFVTGRLNSNIPHMWYVDYVAGYPIGKIPYDVSAIIAKMAAINVLGVAGDAVLAGYASMSTSIDGLSESMSTTASATSATYGAHIKQLQDEVKDYFAKGSARSHQRGITMTGL